MKGIVFDIKKYAIHDGPGVRTTVFLKGCPLKCIWCHNPESIKPECETIITINRKKTLNLSYSETKEVFGREVTSEEVFKEIEKDLLFYDDSGGGVTFSGGEPMMQTPFLLDLLKKCKEIDLHTVVDTSGMVKWDDFKKVAEYTDLFLYDLKIFDSLDHLKYTGVKNEQIFENLKKLTSGGSKVRIRIPLIPEITDTKENIEALVNLARSLNNVEGIDILPFNTMYENKYKKMNQKNKLKNFKRQTNEYLEELRNEIQDAGFDVKVGG